MPILDNQSPFAAIDLLSITKRAEERLVVCVAGRFDLPRPGGSTRSAPRPSEAQAPPPLQDQYWGEPGSSSLRYEGQTAYERPGTDVLVSGRAFAPRGSRATHAMISVRVGGLRRSAVAIGDRVWRREATGLVPSEPVPFESIPLLYERSFGGAVPPRDDGGPRAFEARNPVGVGFYTDEFEAEGKPLPNFEDESALIRDFTDRPAPVGFGPIARSWQPRLAYAGTYDERWLERRAPLFPDDFDERFFQAAPPDAVVTPWLKGGEPVVLEGLSPDGSIAFALPEHRLVAEAVFRDRTDRRSLVLDAVHIEVDERRVMLLWRASFPAHRQLESHKHTTVRLLSPSEERAK